MSCIARSNSGSLYWMPMPVHRLQSLQRESKLIFDGCFLPMSVILPNRGVNVSPSLINNGFLSAAGGVYRVASYV